MRKIKGSRLLLMFFVCALASCSGNEQFLDEPADDEENVVTDGFQYLSVNLVPSSISTRSDVDFKDGTQEESYISKVRFYFFNSYGDPAFVEERAGTWKGQPVSYRSYIDYLPPAQIDKPDDNNIERMVTATLKIPSSNAYVEKKPYSVIAVVNPTGLSDANMSLSELQNVLDDYSASRYTQDRNFLMSNAVYLNNEGVEIKEVRIDKNLHPTITEAMSDWIDIYVERAMARLDISISKEMTSIKVGDDYLYDTGVKYQILDVGKEYPSYDGNIYVKFLGWNITSTPNHSNLVKSIDPSWVSSLFGSNLNPWNLPERNRSLWALNPENVKFNYGNFGKALPSTSNPDKLPYEDKGLLSNANKFAFGNSKASVYLQENAAMVGNNGFCAPGNDTKIIIGAQLVKKDGDPITLVEYDFDFYTLYGLKTYFANYSGIYKKSKTASNETKFTKIGWEDITFVTAGSEDPSINNPQSKGRYYVYPKLINDNNVQWALGDAKDSPTITYEAAAEELKRKFDVVKIWNSGYTYYYFDVRHLGGNNFPGYYGIVRNHIYDTVIKKIQTLGTPVYDPNEVIYPEQPENLSSLIAEIKVLNWRIVTKVIQLQW